MPNEELRGGPEDKASSGNAAGATDTGEASALEVMVAAFLREWEGSDELPSEAARRLVRLVLGNNVSRDPPSEGLKR
jgi:hypothetical protein